MPVKEMLANAPGFRSLYSNREIHFESVYVDVLDRAFLLPLKVRPSTFAVLLREIQDVLGGRVSIRNEDFLLGTRKGTFEFSLLAEARFTVAADT